MDGAQQREVRDRIAGFLRETAVPALEEIAATMNRKGKEAIVYYDSSGVDDDAEDLFDVMHPGTLFVEDLGRSFPDEATIAGGKAELRGPSLIVEEPALGGARWQRLFAVTVMIRLGPGGRVYAAPLVMFHMRFNGKYHKFLHRYDNAVADHSIEQITRHQIQNHFLGAFTFFQIHAGQETRPPGF
jgi:hypothetical protein